MLTAQRCTRCTIPLRFQALPRHRRPLSSSRLRAALAAIDRQRTFKSSGSAFWDATPEETGPSYQTTHASRPPLHTPSLKERLASERKVFSSLLKTTYSLEASAIFDQCFQRCSKDHELMDDPAFCIMLATAAAHMHKANVANSVISTAVKRGVKISSAGYEGVLAKLAKDGAWLPMLNLIDAVLRISPRRVTPRIMHFRIKALMDLRMYNDLRLVLDTCVEHGIPRQRRTYELLVRASLEAQDVAWARHILQTMESEGYPFDGETYAAILNGHRALGPSLDTERRVYHQLRDLGLLSNPNCLNTLMRLRLDAGDTEGAKIILNLFRDQGDLQGADALYAAMYHPLDEQGTLRTQDFPPQPTLRYDPTASVSNPDSPLYGPLPSLSTLNSILHHAATTNDVSRAAAVWNTILAKNFQPTDYTVVSVIRALIGDNETASLCHDHTTLAEFGPQSSKASLVPLEDRRAEAITFAATMLFGADDKRIAQFCANLDVAVTPSQNFQGIPHFPVSPTPLIFNALLRAILQDDGSSNHSSATQNAPTIEGLNEEEWEGHYTLALSLMRMRTLLEEMVAMGCEPDSLILQTFLTHLEKSGRFSVEELVEVMNSLGRPPEPLQRESSSVSFETGVVEGSFSDGMPRNEHSAGRPPVVLTLSHLNVLLRVLRRDEGSTPRDLKTLRGPTASLSINSMHSSAQGPPRRRVHSLPDTVRITRPAASAPDDSPLGAIPTSASGVIDYWSRFLQLQGSDPSPETWDHRIHFAHSAAHASSTLESMRRSSIVPQARHYLALMRKLVSYGDVIGAAKVLSAALAAGVITSIAMFTVLIFAYGNAGHVELARQTFDDMRAHLNSGAVKRGAGAVIDPAAVDALARAYIAVGQPAEARRVVLEHWELVDQRAARLAEAAKHSPRAEAAYEAFWGRMRELRIKALLVALQGLNGAQRRAGGGKVMSQAIRIRTRRLVRKVLKTWQRGEVGAGTKASRGVPKQPVLSMKTRREDVVDPSSISPRGPSSSHS
ncbi:hypothetical protein DL93DRAFT_2080711 [Clavulina sp. PMI_390]|nr:hypothetical protein DL93DRAFT_2080711 [Clavulina sp. PMI_390]